MMKETRVMQLYDHKNAVRFFGFIVDHMPYLLVMEFCDGGAVEDKLRKYAKKITVTEQKKILAQAAAGLEYLHFKESVSPRLPIERCIHRDIAARNYLIDKKVVQLADLDMCRPITVYKYRVDAIQHRHLCVQRNVHHSLQCPYEEWKVKTKVMEGYRLPPAENMPKEIVDIMKFVRNHDATKRPTAAELRHSPRAMLIIIEGTS